MEKWSLVVPWLLSLGTALVGIWQFRAGQSQANKRPFLEQQLAISIEATDTVARLATETDPEEWDKARQAFWRLYWGRLALVEDRGVEARMVRFGRKIATGPVAADRLPMTELQDPAIDLAYAARQLILRSWNIKLARLENEGGEGE